MVVSLTLGGSGVSDSLRRGLGGWASDGDWMLMGAGGALRAEEEIMVVKCSGVLL